MPLSRREPTAMVGEIRSGHKGCSVLAVANGSSAPRKPLAQRQVDRAARRGCVRSSHIDPAEVEFEFNRQARGCAYLESELARQPQHCGVFVKDESGQCLEIALRGACDGEAQEPLADATPRAIGADDQGD